jgi:glucokinase
MRGGIDLGGTKIQTVVIDDDHAVRGQSRHPTPQQGGPQAIAEQMAAALRDAAGQAGVAPGDLAGVGVGSPGEVDQVSGAVSEAGMGPSSSAPHSPNGSAVRSKSTTTSASGLRRR